ncbi:MAG: hypothetical protein H6618_02315 [Deltaproteobacteria bacterium]|nr:hypothetical protein [Deltaproteobacteria bacterium]
MKIVNVLVCLSLGLASFFSVNASNGEDAIKEENAVNEEAPATEEEDAVNEEASAAEGEGTMSIEKAAKVMQKAMETSRTAPEAQAMKEELREARDVLKKENFKMTANDECCGKGEGYTRALDKCRSESGKFCSIVRTTGNCSIASEDCSSK